MFFADERQQMHSLVGHGRPGTNSSETLHESHCCHDTPPLLVLWKRQLLTILFFIFFTNACIKSFDKGIEIINTIKMHLNKAT